MLVNLKRDWFAPGGKRFRARENPNVIPNKLPEGQKYPEDMEVLDKSEKADEDLFETQPTKKEPAAKAEEKK